MLSVLDWGTYIRHFHLLILEFSGASMSGDLQHPSKAIPKGTLSGLALTFVAYTLTVLAMAATVTRPSFYRNVNVIHDVSVGLLHHAEVSLLSIGIYRSMSPAL